VNSAHAASREKRERVVLVEGKGMNLGWRERKLIIIPGICRRRSSD
jgi:hypothetical protein